jgi:single-stranded-DNA-specific exonuclease
LKTAEFVWLEHKPVEISADLLRSAGGNRILAEALVRRGVTSSRQAAEFLDPLKYKPAPPSDLPDLDKAVERITRAISTRETIGIWGDFDADGQTSTTILFSAIQALGAKVQYYIPVRGRESHGISQEGLKVFLARGIQLLITCDTGISSVDEVEYLKSQDIDCIITDHHTLPEALPDALAIVNPQRLQPEHPLRPLCGVGTAYKLIEGLYNHFNRPEEVSQFLDLVAIGTVADLAMLTGDNRFLVQKGLDCIRRSPRLAIRTMLEAVEIDYTQISEEHISYILAPRLNAIGRLADSNPVVRFFLAEQASQAKELVLQMETLNSQRKLLCDQVFQAAQTQMNQDPTLLNDPVLILSHPNWPAGVIGIAASRLAEVHQKPVILIACPPGGAGRASARSIEGINITRALSANQDLLVTFGGHPMAAGFAIHPDNIPKFRQAINRSVLVEMKGQPAAHELTIDCILPLERLTLELVETLDRLSPYGPGNPPFVLATRNLLLKSASPIGKAREHLQLVVEDPTGTSRRIIWWQGAGLPLPEERFDLAYTVRASNYRGERGVQIEWLHARVIPENTGPARRSTIKTLDLRKETDPIAALNQLRQQGPLIVWQEGELIQNVAGQDRYHLSPSQTLVIWNIPPGLSELRTILEAVQPVQVAFFGIRSASDLLTEFLSRLAGLLRFAINKHGGQVTLFELAAATAQREWAVRKGLDWWASHGEISKTEVDNSTYIIKKGGNPDQNNLDKIETELINLLQETSAFRTYFLRANPEQLLE